MDSTRLLGLFGVAFLLLIGFGRRLYKMYDEGLVSYYHSSYKNEDWQGQPRPYSEFVYYVWGMWFFVILTGVGSVVAASVYIKTFLL